MKQKLKDLYQRHGDILRYLIIGGLTTLIDFVTFTLCYNAIGIHYLVSKAIAWVLAVVFAFWGNRVVVFRSRTSGGAGVAKEAGGFLVMRVLTLLFTLAFMHVTVEWLHVDENIANLIVTIFVVVLNYVFSKLVVFRKGKES